MAISDDILAQVSLKAQPEEGSSGGNNMKVISNPLFAKQGEIQARLFARNFLDSMDRNPLSGFLKLNNSSLIFKHLIIESYRLHPFTWKGMLFKD